MLILITGGSASGKSSFGERLFCELPAENRVYIATMKPYGAEELEKIEKHRKMREGKEITAVEQYTDIDRLKLPGRSSVMLECVCNLTANEMFDDDGAEHEMTGRIIEEILNVSRVAENMIVITNDVGSDLITQYSDSTKRYINAVGKINAALAREADIVIEMVCGIPLLLKGDRIW